MKDKPIIAKEDFKDVHFPGAGVDVSQAFSAQPNRQTSQDDNQWARTCRVGNNVRGWDPVTTRNRGGSRPGIVRYLAAQVSGEEFIVQQLDTLVSVTEDPMQQSQLGRVVTLVAVSQGNVFYCVAGGTTWTEATNNTGETPPLNFTGNVYSSANIQKLFLVDGINYVYFTPIENTLTLWETTLPDGGELPADEDGNFARLICTWRGRTVLSGLLKDPQNWFMSAVDNPFDFNYSPLSPSATQAVAGNNGPAGLIGDVITAMIPYTDDVLIFGCDHQIWIMRGDPMEGGQIDMVSSAIGMAWQAWCLDPYGNVYFFSNRMGIYRMVPGQQPVRISQSIDQLLVDIDTGTNGIMLLWNDRFQGFHVFVTPLEVPGPTTHFFYEQRSGAWWTDTFTDEDQNPTCCCIFDGNLPSDRVALVGGWDGYVRAVSVDADTDDGKAIVSSVVLGPFLTQNLDDVMMKDIQAVLGETSSDVTFEIFVGTTAEAALSSEPILAGTWTAGRNFNNYIRHAAHALYVRISSSKPWAFESFRLRLAAQGKVRMRSEI